LGNNHQHPPVPGNVLESNRMGNTTLLPVSDQQEPTLASIDSNNTVWAWGYNGFGQLGDNSTTNRSLPVQVMKKDTNAPTGTSTLTNITEIAAGSDFSLALDGDGAVWAWGNNAKGQLGVPAATIPTTSLIAVKVTGLDV
jgi:YD repeat-containing protein